MEEKIINFCESCKYFDEEDNEGKVKKCPKCGTYLWTMYEHNYYHGKMKVGSEAGLTDNDECSLHGDKLSRLKRIFDKGYKLFKEAKQ